MKNKKFIAFLAVLSLFAILPDMANQHPDIARDVLGFILKLL